jgi:hypothetical protein
MKRLAFIPALSALLALVFLGGSAPGQSLDRSDTDNDRLTLSGFLQDGWGTPDEAEEPPDGMDEEWEGEAPPPPPQNPPSARPATPGYTPYPPPSRSPRGRLQGWRASRYQRQPQNQQAADQYYQKRFQGRLKMFNIRLGGEIGLIGGTYAGDWPKYGSMDYPDYNDLFGYNISIGLAGSIRLLPFLEIASGLGLLSFEGKDETAYTGSKVYLENWSITTFWVGPKLAFPFSLPKRYWTSRQALRDVRSMGLYLIPVSLGVAYKSRVKAEYQGTTFTYFEEDSDLMYSARIGFEMHIHGIGFYLEAGFAILGAPGESDTTVLDTDGDWLITGFAQGGINFCF